VHTRLGTVRPLHVRKAQKVHKKYVERRQGHSADVRIWGELMFRHRKVREIVVLLSSLGVIGAVTAALKTLPEVSPTTAALALLLVVLGAATLARLRTAVAVSLLAMLTLNFFFLPPVGTFTIADPQNWIALFAFLVVAIIASNLSAAAQDRARDAIARRNEVTRLFDLTRDVLLTTETAGAIDILARHVARRFELTKVAVCLPGDHGWHIHQGGSDALDVDVHTLNTALARARGTLEFDARQRAYGGHVRVGKQLEVVIVPLRHGTKAVGLLAATSSALDIGALDAVAGVVAIAIERAQFLGERDAAALVRQKADLAATLLASLSHDLRTPLTAVRVAVENLRGDLPEPERRTQAGAAMTELERLTRLFQDILDMARIDAAAIRIERQWVTAADVVDAALAHVRHAVEGHALRVEADAEMEVEIDPRLTSVALAHVIENAAHYSPVDRPIVVRAQVTEDGLRISVTDQGPGLDPGELEHLFERFYRGRSARQATFGTGMGLSITRGLLSAAGGRIWAENAPGAGAMFSLAVPGAVRVATVAS
jgi:two-component system, OmpR family, sensor histidine kinase KdpD